MQSINRDLVIADTTIHRLVLRVTSVVNVSKETHQRSQTSFTSCLLRNVHRRTGFSVYAFDRHRSTFLQEKGTQCKKFVD